MAGNPPKIETKLAGTDAERLACYGLRYDVFVSELGGTGADVDHQHRLERDAFDAYADHLIAIDRANSDAVVGAYRLMTDQMAVRAGRFYSEDEYDVSGLKGSGRRLLELGRSCVHKDYRDGATIFQMWQALAEYVAETKIEVLFGVASFHGTDPEKYAHALSYLAQRYTTEGGLCPISRGNQPMTLIDPSRIDRAAAVAQIPPLIKSYLRLGGTVGQGAFIDHDFNTIDVCLIMETQKMSGMHRDLYTKAAAS